MILLKILAVIGLYIFFMLSVIIAVSLGVAIGMKVAKSE